MKKKDFFYLPIKMILMRNKPIYYSAGLMYDVNTIDQYLIIILFKKIAVTEGLVRLQFFLEAVGSTASAS